MQYYLKGSLLLLLGLVFVTPVEAQRSQTESVQPTVILAVAPNYFPTALHSHATGEVTITARISADGSVLSTEGVSGNPVLVAGSRQIARRWKFAAAVNKDAIRTACLTFVYRLVPRDAPADELLPIFKPPYRVEIAHVLPDETPLP
jgi:hypothetical protein